MNRSNGLIKIDKDCLPLVGGDESMFIEVARKNAKFAPRMRG